METALRARRRHRSTRMLVPWVVMLAVTFEGALFLSLSLQHRTVARLGAGETAEAKELGAVRAAILELRHRLAPETQHPSPDAIDPAEMVARALDSVVTVTVGRHEGSGFAVEFDGIPLGYRTAIITNEHVIHTSRPPHGDQVLVMREGRVFRARLGPWDAAHDLALVFVKLEIPPLRLTDLRRPLRVGETVYAVGSPFLLQGSVTSGIVSRVDPDVIQTDAPVNPGNSGGPLLNSTGEAAGVVVGKVPGADGLGFAIPSDVARRFLDRSSSSKVGSGSDQER